MRISRVFTDQALGAGQVVELDEGLSHYLQRVLKLRVGDALVLFNGDGSDHAGELVGVERRKATVALHARLPAAAESPLEVTLVQAVSRGERMDLTLQKATELGVAAVQPVFTERVEVRLEAERLERRMAHWLAVLRSACEQSGRGRVPRLAAPVLLEDWLGRVVDHPRLVLDPAAERNLSALTVRPGPIEFLVGPEGGLTDSELQRLEGGGVLRVRLGPRILRTETAGPAALAVLQALGGDF